MEQDLDIQLIGIIMLIATVVLIIQHFRGDRDIYKTILKLTFTFYVVCVVKLCFFPIVFAYIPVPNEHFIHPYNIQLIPFNSIINIWAHENRRTMLTQLGGNIIMLAPLSIFIPLIKDHKVNFLKMLLIGFLTSACIELLQLLGSFLQSFVYAGGYKATDIDDTILNMFGIILGYLLYLLFKPVFKKVQNTLSPSTTEN